MNLKYENLVLGNSLESLIYAAINNYFVIYVNSRRPFFYERFDSSDDLSWFGINNISKEMITNKKKYHAGHSKQIFMHKLLFAMSLSGLVLKIKSQDFLSQNEKNNLILRVKNKNKVHFVYDNMFVFDDIFINQCSTESEIIEGVKIYDFLELKTRGGGHNYDLFQFDDNFVKNVWFGNFDVYYKKNKGRRKHAIAVSEFPKYDNNSDDYHEVYVKNKIVKEFKTLKYQEKYNIEYYPTRRHLIKNRKVHYDYENMHKVDMCIQSLLKQSQNKQKNKINFYMD